MDLSLDLVVDLVVEGTSGRVGRKDVGMNIHQVGICQGVASLHL